MAGLQVTRRQFLGTTVASVGVAAAVRPSFGWNPDGWNPDAPGLAGRSPLGIQIDDPVHGAVLHASHGKPVEGGLTIQVRGHAPVHARVLVNGLVAQRNEAAFGAEVTLRKQETDIVATVDGSPESKHLVRVLWDRNSRKRYRFAIDDNSFFLRDIWQTQPSSLFDCSYLAMLRRLNRSYRTKFVLNIYYTTADEFDLTKFPDRYRAEWRNNAHWLKLAFHAHANEPANPYLDVPPEQVIADFDQVGEQIHRFAGEETYSPTTIVHWGMVRPSTWKPLAQRGVKVLSGYFEKRAEQWTVNYRMDPIRSEYLSRHDALKDFPSGIVFSKIDMVCNSVPLEQIVPRLKQIANHRDQAEVFDLMTHEQYFWPFYSNHLPDHPQRIEAAIRFVTDQGYEPVFLHEGLLGL